MTRRPAPVAPDLAQSLRAVPEARRATASIALALAAAATGRTAAHATIVDAALELCVEPAALLEGALMTHLFAGFPRAIETLAALEAVLRRRGIAWPRAETAAHADRARVGLAAFERVYGKQADRVRAALAALHPELERAVLEDAYGRVLSRGGLDARARELASVCALTALDLPRQLHSHLKGALACGATVDDLDEMVKLAADLVAACPARPPDIAGARALVAQVASSVR